MFLLFALILISIALTIPVNNIIDIPFSQLTIKMISQTIFAIALWIGALNLFSKSLDEDRIWPWKWTLPYFGNLILRGALIAIALYFTSIFVERGKLSDWQMTATLIVLAVCVLMFLFSSEFNAFKEAKNSDNKEGYPSNETDTQVETEETTGISPSKEPFSYRLGRFFSGRRK